MVEGELHVLPLAQAGGVKGARDEAIIRPIPTCPMALLAALLRGPSRVMNGGARPALPPALEPSSHRELCPHDRGEPCHVDRLVRQQVVESDDAHQGVTIDDGNAAYAAADHGVGGFIHARGDGQDFDRARGDGAQRELERVLVMVNEGETDVPIRDQPHEIPPLAQDDGADVVVLHGAGCIVNAGVGVEGDHATLGVLVESHD